MTVPPQPPQIFPDLSPRPSRLIGRQNFRQAIYTALADNTDRSHTLYFVGLGGIGKTRLLEEVDVIQHEWTGKPLRVTPIINLYYPEMHSPDGLRQAIAEGLDPERQYFDKYRELDDKAKNLLNEGVTGRPLEELRQQRDQQFQDEYAVLARGSRLVLRFDTLELVQHESDRVQKHCRVEDVDTAIKTWFLEHASRLPNTVMIFAGRPRSKMQEDFKRAFTQAGQVFGLHELKTLTLDETKAYLDDIRQQRPEKLADKLTQEIQNRLFRITRGRPIYLTLLMDFMAYDESSLSKIFPVEAEEVKEDEVRKRLVEHLQALPSPLGELINFLVLARKGLNGDLLRYLVGDLWTESQVQENLARAEQFAFVKPRRETGQLFLHDEVYDLFDDYYRDDVSYGKKFEKIAQYYREKLEQESLPRKREELMLARLYYEFQVNARVGYYQCYARWDEELIKGHETDLDMLLRDEGLRFMNRYANPESPFYDRRVTALVERDDIDRDCAVRWVKRYIVRGKLDIARQVAETLRYSKDPIFDWEAVDDPLYKAGLLTAWSEALLYSAEEQARSLLEEARQLLENGREWDEDQRWWRARVLGRTYNNIGYLYRTQGRYGLALQQYRHALTHFTEANILDEEADTRNNLGFLLALLGRLPVAKNHVERALQIRTETGKKYPIALSRNTLGLVYTMEDHPIWGIAECEEALRIVEELQIPRGIGLASIRLGFALRKRGDQWKSVKTYYSPEKAEESFQEATRHLERAVRIFSEQLSEPIRLWEAYNELGSLYCDWGWLARRTRVGWQTALEHYERSVEYQNRALTTARSRGLEFQIADSLDDLAQAYGDQSFLLFEMGRQDAAKESRANAETCLNQAEQMIPQGFKLTPGEGFVAAPEPGEAYWLSLGKAHLWRGIWAFRDLEHGTVPDRQREHVLQRATWHLIVAVAYFQRYWPASYLLERTLKYFSGFLQAQHVSAEWAHEQVVIVTDEFQLDLKVLEETIDDMLGI